MKNIDTLTDDQKRAIGEKIAAVMLLKKSKNNPDRYLIGEGHCDKTALGVFETTYSLLNDEIHALTDPLKLRNDKLISDYKAVYSSLYNKEYKTLVYVGHGMFLMDNDPSMPAERIRVSDLIAATKRLQDKLEERRKHNSYTKDKS